MSDSLPKLRPATREDAPLILQFVRELAEYERLSHEVAATEADFERDLFGPNAFVEVILAFENDAPAGYALFFPNYSTFAGRPGLYLEDLFVCPEFRGRGYGKALMIALARIAKQRNYARFEWSVLDWNEPSIQFYRSIGAVAQDEWTTQRLSGAALGKLAQTKSLE